MALFTLSIKTAIGVASLLIGLALSFSGYESGEVATGMQAGLFRILVGAVVLLSMTVAILAMVRDR